MVSSLVFSLARYAISHLLQIYVRFTIVIKLNLITNHSSNAFPLNFESLRALFKPSMDSTLYKHSSHFTCLRSMLHFYLNTNRIQMSMCTYKCTNKISRYIYAGTTRNGRKIYSPEYECSKK